ncbi:hypothetical protein AB8Z38_28790 [Bradyrhizobium sp. LLZ17]|uniref:Uncharacterized protein n=1 Tax=Bradyrhizobium sp. LLZ17 TaxID=3239388 RepID=A0AB39XHI3_9BRAD
MNPGIVNPDIVKPLGGHDSDCGNAATLKRVPLHRKKLRPDLEKVYGLARMEARFLATIRNFAVEIAHIRQALSSEQFCSLRSRENENVPGLVPPARP